MKKIIIILIVVFVTACNFNSKKATVNEQKDKESKPKITYVETPETITFENTNSDETEISDTEVSDDGTKMEILTFDSVSVYNTVGLKNLDRGSGKDMLRNNIFYFSDENKNVWEFYANKRNCFSTTGYLWNDIYDLNGYGLDEEIYAKKFQNMKFKVNWKETKFVYRDNRDSIERKLKLVSNLRLVENISEFSWRKIEIYPEDDIVEAIRKARAFDRFFIKKGVYNMGYASESAINVLSNHIEVYGEPGTFIYAGPSFDVLFVDAQDVLIHKLYLAHTAADMCGGSVIGISGKSRDVRVENCDINGCGSTGISLGFTNLVTYKTFKNSGFYFKNNLIHNNSDCALYMNGKNYNEFNNIDFEGVVFENNKVWNNGEGKINEPSEYCHVFAIGLSKRKYNYLDDNLMGKIDKLHRYEDIYDKPIPIYHNYYAENGEEKELLIAMINLFNFVDPDQKGVLVYHKPHNIRFFEDVDEAISFIKNPTTFSKKR